MCSFSSNVMVYSYYFFTLRAMFPTETRQVLSEHSDEVWFLRFSNNGKYLATGSKDMNVILWKIEVIDCLFYFYSK